jgi:hypothetical protein
MDALQARALILIALARKAFSYVTRAGHQLMSAITRAERLSAPITGSAAGYCWQLTIIASVTVDCWLQQ